MTTRLTKPVKRVVPSRTHGALVLTLTVEGVMVREQGRRLTYGPIPYGKLLQDGARMYIEAEKRRKAELKKARRAGNVR